MPYPVDTKRVTGRSELHFASTDDVLNHAIMLASHDRAGTLRLLGNWTLGQALGHLASWVKYSYDGYPFPVPCFIRAFGPLIKSRTLNCTMAAGLRFRKALGGTYGTELLTTEEGLGRLKRAFEKLKHTPPTRPSPVFGKMSPEQWTKLHLRHAELHLSFFANDHTVE